MSARAKHGQNTFDRSPLVRRSNQTPPIRPIGNRENLPDYPITRLPITQLAIGNRAPDCLPDCRLPRKAFGNPITRLERLDRTDYPIADYPTKMHSAIGAVGIQVGSRNFTDCRLQKQSSRQSAIGKCAVFFDYRLGGSDCSALVNIRFRRLNPPGIDLGSRAICQHFQPQSINTLL